MFTIEIEDGRESPGSLVLCTYGLVNLFATIPLGRGMVLYSIFKVFAQLWSHSKLQLALN